MARGRPAKTFLRILRLLLEGRFRSSWIKVSGFSMLPLLKPGAILAVDSGFILPQLRRGILTAIWNPLDPHTLILKRLVGLPNETVVFTESQHVFVDGKPLNEPYARRRGSGESSFRWALGNGEYVVLGDNRLDSFDSRRFGPLEVSEFFGIAWLRINPPKRFLY